MKMDKVFSPASVAVIGASREEDSVGQAILSNLKESHFTGELYAVNPNADEVIGIESFDSITDIDAEVDLAVVTVPEKAVKQVIQDCLEVKVGAIVVITAGFSESGEEEEEQYFREVADEHNIPIVGPNCMGVINTGGNINLNATFADSYPPEGNISFLSQSGALGIYALKYSQAEKIGFDCFASLGNKAVVNENSLIDYFAERDSTQVVMAYLEDFTNPQELRKMAQKLVVKKKKPLIVLKSGRSEKGKKAAASHTGALTSKPEVVDDILDQFGIIKANDIQQLFNFGRFFSQQKDSKGNRTVILTNAGGPSVIATDRAEQMGLKMVEFSEELYDQISESLPDEVSISNPIDILGDADTDRYREVLKVLLASDEIDNLMIINTPQRTTDLEGLAEMISNEVKQTKAEKAIVANIAGFEDMKVVEEKLFKASIPNYHFTTDAVDVVSAAVKFNQFVSRKKETTDFDVDKDKVREVLNYAEEKGFKYIPAPFSYPVFEAYGLKVTKHKLAKSAKDAPELAHEVGFPVAMNIVSQDVIHKTGTGGVKLNVSSRKEAERAFEEIVTAIKKEQKDAKISGVQVQPMISNGPEMILGVQKSQKYGHLLMFGLGGSFVEVLEDVAFKMIPVCKADVEDMITNIRSRKILDGIRGNDPSDIDALIEALLRLSQLVQDFPEIEEIDLNPVYALNKGAIIADARIMLEDD